MREKAYVQISMQGGTGTLVRLGAGLLELVEEGVIERRGHEA